MREDRHDRPLGSLLSVFLVSLASAVAVVTLVTAALLGFSVRVAAADAAPASRLSRGVETAVAVACLAAAALVVLFRFWVILVR